MLVCALCVCCVCACVREREMRKESLQKDSAYPDKYPNKLEHYRVVSRTLLQIEHYSCNLDSKVNGHKCQFKTELMKKDKKRMS